MPVISTFYGIVVMMFYLDRKRHHLPHIHARFQEHEVVLSIPDGRILEGSFPPAKMKLLLAWIEIRKKELMNDWRHASKGEAVSKIEPLR